MQVRKAYDRMNLVTALAVVIMLGVTVWCGYQQYAALFEDGSPPAITLPSRDDAAAQGAPALYWIADYPGGRLYPAAADGGYVLFRAIRGKYDQYLLFSSSGDLLWQGERRYRSPAPRTAIRTGADEVFLAIETEPQGAAVLAFSAGGTTRAEAPLKAFPGDDDESWFAIKTSDRDTRSRPLSPDGKWYVEYRIRIARGWLGSRLRLFGPGS